MGCFQSKDPQTNKSLPPNPRTENILRKSTSLQFVIESFSFSRLDDMISKYDIFLEVEKKKVRDQIRLHLRKKIGIFKEINKKILGKKKDSIFGLNLITGTSGSGKSTFFNYIHGFPLVGEKQKHQQKAHILKQKGQQARRNSYMNYSQIGDGFVPKTTYHIFANTDGRDSIDVDLPGQFEDKNFIQSIINAVLKMLVCQVASQAKFTIVMSYNQLNDGASAFENTAGEIERFIGSWRNFNPDAVYLMITKVPNQQENPLFLIKNKLDDIAKNQEYDIREFKTVLKAIIQGQAYGVLPNSALKTKPQPNKGTKANKREKQKTEQKNTTAGRKYLDEQSNLSPQVINEKIASLQYMKINEGLEHQGLKPSLLKIVRDTCEQLIRQVNGQHLNTMKLKIKSMIKEDLEYIGHSITLRTIFGVQKEFLKNQMGELQQLLKLIKSMDFNRQIIAIKTDVEMLILQRINELYQEQRKQKQKKLAALEKERTRLNLLYEKRSRLRQVEDIIRQSQQGRLNLPQQDKQRLEKQWHQIRDEISEIQNDQQKSGKVGLEHINQLRIQADVMNLQSDYLKKKKKKNRDQKLRCLMKLEVGSSKEHMYPVYKLILQRRVKKIDEELQRIKKIKKKKQEYLEQNEKNVQEISGLILSLIEKMAATKDKNEKNRLRNLILQNKKNGQPLQREWLQLKDYISDIQDEQQKWKITSQYQKYDVELSQETDDYWGLSTELLQQKIKSLRQKYDRLDQFRQEIKGDYKRRFQYLKIKRRMGKLRERYQRCQYIKNG